MTKNTKTKTSKAKKKTAAKARPVYQVEITRSGKWWAIEVPELPGTYSQAKRIDQVETMAREATAITADVDESSFDITHRDRLRSDQSCRAS